MLIIPAIDLKDGKCVRLRQGRMHDDTVFDDDPVRVAQKWLEQGARRIHLVDLDGAFAGAPKNAELVKNICRSCGDIPVQIGGGIRTEETAAAYIDAGIRWLIIGTLALKKPEFVDALCTRFPDQVIVGLDANNGLVATEGWAEASSVSAISLAQRFEHVGVSAIVYTDISRDGMMQGVNVDATAELASAVSIPVIASGGVSTLADVDSLLAHFSQGVSGVIVGRALYEEAIDLAKAQQLADSHVTRLE
ncbi:MAG: 1-(5-phosphoribosyl)-5-[(5-phosphoribosylamino)methylideneamino]imidazole-4-carboxamide isomerase [Granulosicoccus sp.]|nr:1-(5-phosphoribosyl)-5-[(5-phosphoribosylamino)methylideneamino]imidazole-4-carboxamide isomerase [Granulosicoccus sp.]